MGKFLTRLRIELDETYPEIGNWVVVSPLKYHSCILNMEITVPVMFYTDLGTVPRIFYPVLNNSDKIIAAPSVIHHFLYVSKLTDRRTADKILKEAMIASKSTVLMANLAYLVVRMFGNFYYKG
jgi:hypothetical protein